MDLAAHRSLEREANFKWVCERERKAHNWKASANVVADLSEWDRKIKQLEAGGLKAFKKEGNWVDDPLLAVWHPWKELERSQGESSSPS